jgi:DNA-binding IclR family transcriptional regulator
MPAKSPSTTEDRAGRPSAVQTVERTLDALEILAERGDSLGVGELADALGVSDASAHRVLSTLHARGYARQDPVTTKYAIGLRTFSLATLAMADLDLRAAAAAHMRHLNELTGEIVHLALYDDGNVFYIDRLEGKHAVGPISRIGARAPAHCVATGRAILAYQPDAEIARLVERGLERFTDATPVTRKDIDADRAATRERGYAINAGAWREEIAGVAVPVRDYSGRVVASLGVCLPAQRFTAEARETIVDQTIDAGQQVSAELGFVAAARLAR